jgi:hypothetical protein
MWKEAFLAYFDVMSPYSLGGGEGKDELMAFVRNLKIAGL